MPSDDEDQSAPNEEEGTKSETDSSLAEEKEELEGGPEEPPQMLPPKQRKKHIIGEEDDESEEEPLVPVLSWKGKEKIISSDELEEDAEYINAELEVAATKVTHTATKKKCLLYIIVEITGEGSAAAKSAPVASQQTLTNLLP